MTVIDAHTHVFPQYADLAVRVMDRCGVERSVTLEWHDGFGETLRDHLATFDRYPGRFVVFGNVDFRRINEDGFAAAAAEQIARDADAGLRGVKVYKALGLEYKRPDGTFWRVDDERLDPIWAKAGELGLPVLIHTADPVQFWQPVDESNFWNGVLHGEYDWWTYHRKGYPSRDELIAERNAVIRRHPGTTFLCPHVGSRADALDLAADDLDAMPNLLYDFSARVPILGLPGRHARRTREFFIEFQDRILFGTDSIYDDTHVPTGMQAQCLYQPGEGPLGGALDGADPDDRYVETSAVFLQAHIEFLTTGQVQEDPPFRRHTAGFSTQGLGLPADVSHKILCGNAERIIPV